MQTFKTSKARENILGRIRKSLGSDKLPMPFPEADKVAGQFYPDPDVSPEEMFAEIFISLGGKFIFVENEQELMATLATMYENLAWKQLLCADQRLLKLFKNSKVDFIEPADPAAESADACVTGCEALVGRTGSILLSSAQNMGRTAPVYYPVHIVFAYMDQVVFDITDALKLIRKRYNNVLPSMVYLATGPSRTADIEKTLVVGVHGPAEVYCILVNAEM
ncbi:MAG: LUD domain-containing protein [Taibaiella sp.]|nr:LUD domain-containing protein [Taibaiella sp.]